ncbi:TIR domain-containing protein [Sabulibacter ruber]|uniref:TIR domain-containing protein n=1 Tax=Sabulibacter ruber TaxID=2811901 RepID=UPI001A965767|nr:TIR domain-containing protein [Sabulibacter ruber]
MAKKVFISYDHSEDKIYKELLRAWDANSAFSFEFDQRSPNIAINSTDSARIKQSLTRMMMDAEYLFVIIGRKSWQSNWMNWEIERAKQSDIKLKLAAVKIDYYNTTPSGLLNTGTSFATSFTQDKIITALNNAKNNY